MAKKSAAADNPADHVSKQIVRRAVDELAPDPENARKHSEVDVDAIAASLKEFGQQTPIVLDSGGIVVKGNGTLLAAIKLGWTEIDTVTTSLQGARLRAYAIADNQTGLLSEWDVERLTDQLQSFDEDLKQALGFAQHELDEYCPPPDDSDKVPVDPHERGLPGSAEPEEDKYSVRVDGVTQDDKEAVVTRINQLLKDAGFAYSATAY